MSLNVDEHFECPKCGGNRVEEILNNVIQTTEVLRVIDGAVEDYGSPSNDEGDFDRFQCLDCGWKLPVDTFEDLFQYLSNPDRECKPGCYSEESADEPTS